MSDTKQTEKPKLTDRQQLFVEHYLVCWNAAAAARKAGYAHATANREGSRLLSNVDIQERIQERIAQVAMGADEVLLRMASHARGTIEHFLTDPTDDELNEGAAFLDLNSESARSHLHLVKKTKTKRRSFKERDPDDPESVRPVVETEIEIELHDAQAALVHMGRHHKLWTDKTEHSGDVNVGVVRVPAKAGEAEWLQQTQELKQ